MYFTGHMYLTLKWKIYIKRWCLQFLIYQRKIELQLELLGFKEHMMTISSSKLHLQL